MGVRAAPYGAGSAWWREKKGGGGNTGGGKNKYHRVPFRVSFPSPSPSTTPPPDLSDHIKNFLISTILPLCLVLPSSKAHNALIFQS